MAVDWTKPIQTRDGRKAEFLRETNHTEYPMLCLVTDSRGIQQPTTYTSSGAYWRDNPCFKEFDIINTPEPSPVEDEVVTWYAPVAERDGCSHYVSDTTYSTAKDALGHRPGPIVGVAEIRVRMKR